MRWSRFVLRVGICIVIVGVAVFLANVTSSLQASFSSSSFEVPAHGTDAWITSLKNRPYEIRVLVMESFNGTFRIYDYEGTKKLAEGEVAVPTVEQTLQGPVLFDFTPSRRGAYMIVVKSHIAESAGGSVGTVEKKSINMDYVVDSTIIILAGLVITLAAVISERTRISS